MTRLTHDKKKMNIIHWLYMCSVLYLQEYKSYFHLYLQKPKKKNPLTRKDLTNDDIKKIHVSITASRRTDLNYRVLGTSTAAIFLSNDHSLYSRVTSDDCLPMNLKIVESSPTVEKNYSFCIFLLSTCSSQVDWVYANEIKHEIHLMS